MRAPSVICLFAWMIPPVPESLLNLRLLTLCRSYRPREADNVSKLGKGKSGTTAYFQNLYLSSPENLAKVAKNRAESENFGGCMETRKFFTV